MMPSTDVENGTVASPSVSAGGTTADHTDAFTIGDESTLQAPPSMMDDHDLEDGGLDGDDDDDDGPSHDLPTPEEYKAKMGSIAAAATTNRNGNVDIDAGDDNEDGPVHDLPTVEDYKIDQHLQHKKRNQGLWTFIVLFLVTAIVTA
jgi:hypothetical protein